MKNIEYKEFKDYYEKKGIECPVRLWEFNLKEVDLKKKDFQKWYFVYKFNEYVEIENKFNRTTVSFKEFREKIGLHPQDFFSNIYRDKLIEIVNFKEYRGNWNWIKCYKKGLKKINEDNCEWLRLASNEDIAFEIIDGQNSKFLIKLVGKITKKNKD